MDQPQVSGPGRFPSAADEAKNGGSTGRVHPLPGDGAGGAAAVTPGRRGRRQERKAERGLEPPMIEFVAHHENGSEARHRGPVELVEPMARAMRADGWRVCWLPTEDRDYPAWNWPHPRWGRA